MYKGNDKIKGVKTQINIKLNEKLNIKVAHQKICTQEPCMTHTNANVVECFQRELWDTNRALMQCRYLLGECVFVVIF